MSSLTAGRFRKCFARSWRTFCSLRGECPNSSTIGFPRLLRNAQKKKVSGRSKSNGTNIAKSFRRCQFGIVEFPELPPKMLFHVCFPQFFPVSEVLMRKLELKCRGPKRHFLQLQSSQTSLLPQMTFFAPLSCLIFRPFESYVRSLPHYKFYT
jgi:hypothetical protein